MEERDLVEREVGVEEGQLLATKLPPALHPPKLTEREEREGAVAYKSSSQFMANSCSKASHQRSASYQLSQALIN